MLKFVCVLTIVGVKRDAEENMMSDASMSSDDTDFNPDNLEAMSAKEEYDSEPSGITCYVR